MKTRALFLVLIAATGCVPTVDDDLSRVEDARILAVQAFPAEAKLGARVTLTTLIAAPDDGDAPVDWQLCIERKPLTELGPVSQRCLVPGAREHVTVALGRGESVETTVPSDACSQFGPSQPQQMAGSDEPAGRPVDPDGTGGFYQPVVAFLGGKTPSLGSVRLDCPLLRATTQTLAAYSSRHRINENPRVSSLVVVRGKDETDVPPVDASTPPPTVKPGERVILRAGWASCPRTSRCGDGVCGPSEDAAGCNEDCATPVGCQGAETYAYYDPRTQSVVDRREGIAVSWYATDGDFDERRTGVAESDPETDRTENGWTAPNAEGPATLWAVIRDDRGGVGWQRYRIDVAR